MTDIVDRIKHYIIDKNINQGELANKLGYSEEYISRILRRKNPINDRFVMKIIKLFPELDKNIKSDIDKTDLNQLREPPPIYETKNGRKIPFFNTEVFATISPAMADVVALKPDTFIRIPIFAQGEFALQVTGNSMKGIINHGDWIVVKRITNKEAIIYGEVFLIVTKSDNLKTVKYIKEHENSDYLWLIPYNIEQFQPQTIRKEEILELYIVSGLFRSM